VTNLHRVMAGRTARLVERIEELFIAQAVGEVSSIRLEYELTVDELGFLVEVMQAAIADLEGRPSAAAR
jgi:hypothetical protein